MNKPLLIIIVYASLLGGCASTSRQSEQVSSSYYSVACADPSIHEDGLCDERVYESDDSELVDFLGYVVFRVVVEGIVHMIVYH